MTILVGAIVLITAWVTTLASPASASRSLFDIGHQGLP